MAKDMNTSILGRVGHWGVCRYGQGRDKHKSEVEAHSEYLEVYSIDFNEMLELCRPGIAIIKRQSHTIVSLDVRLYIPQEEL